MWSLPAVKRQTPGQRPLQGAGRGKVVPTELDAPVRRSRQPAAQYPGNPTSMRQAPSGPPRPRRRRSGRTRTTRRNHPPFVGHGQFGRTPTPGGPPFRIQSVSPVARQLGPPPIAYRPRHAIASTRRAHVATALRRLQNPQPEPLYAVVESHWGPSVRVSLPNETAWKNRPHGPRSVSGVRQPRLSTPKRNFSG